MKELYYKTEKLLGEKNVELLCGSTVAIIGLGGVGSFAAEGIARCGVGKIIVADKDTLEATNLNRQLYALTDTLGCLKTRVAAQRILSINPNCKVTEYPFRVSAPTLDTVFTSKCDYIIDAIDSVDDKMELIAYAINKNIPIISAMGTANRLDIDKLSVADINATANCPFAKVIRKRCREMGIQRLKTVYSSEIPINRPPEPAACVFVPAAAGMMLAAEVIKDLTGIRAASPVKG